MRNNSFLVLLKSYTYLSGKNWDEIFVALQYTAVIHLTRNYFWGLHLLISLPLDSHPIHETHNEILLKSKTSPIESVQIWYVVICLGLMVLPFIKKPIMQWHFLLSHNNKYLPITWAQSHSLMSIIKALPRAHIEIVFGFLIYHISTTSSTLLLLTHSFFQKYRKSSEIEHSEFIGRRCPGFLQSSAWWYSLCHN